MYDSGSAAEVEIPEEMREAEGAEHERLVEEVVEIDDDVQSLRGSVLRPGRSARLAAVFAYGMGQTRYSATVSVAPSRHETLEKP